jgi:hypothetical protein
MINGVHLLLYSNDPVADQAALNDVLASVSVPAGDERLIFALPPSEIATHAVPPDFTQRHAGHDLLGAVLYLMCDDLNTSLIGFRRHLPKGGYDVQTYGRPPSAGHAGNSMTTVMARLYWKCP